MLRQRKTTSRRFARLLLERLEDRTLPSGSGTSDLLAQALAAGGADAYQLYTYGNAYTGAPGQDLKSFLANYQSFNPALAAPSVSPLIQPPASVPDPGATGPYAVMTQQYNLGNLAFRPTDSPWASSGIELTGEITAPTDLGTTAHPVIVLLHGRHSTTYDPTGGGAFLEWPPTGTHLSIPSYQGYEYLSNVLASQGNVVVSISANGINARDNSAADAGALARAQLLQRTYNILENLNTDGVIRTRPADATHPGTDLFTGTSSPFGTRFVGKLNLQDIGIMGHSRGGEGVVRGYLLNQSLGSPYGIKAVFALAPIDFQNELINNVPFAVLLPYNDGDVSDLQGAHFFDDSRYNVPGDTGPKFSIEVMGADHNFYNTVWSPGLFPYVGAPSGFGGTADDGNSGPPTRLTETQQQGTGLAYMAAFFRTYVGGETQFLPILTGDATPPASAQVTSDRIHLSYLPPDNSTVRRDVNRLLTTANLTTNTLGGAVVTGGLATYTVGGPVSGEVNRDNQLSLGYTGTLTAFYENDLPAGTRDERAYNDLQFRIGVNWSDSRNPQNVAQDFTVTLTDGTGASFSTLVSAYSNDLFYPPRSTNPHEVLNTVRIPLSAFVGHIDLSDVRAIRFTFDQHNSAAFQIADLAFADPASSAGPYVVASTPSGNVLGAQSSVRFTFDRAIDPTTFTTASIDSFTRTVGSTVTDLSADVTGVAPVSGSGGTQFDVSFNTETTLGQYQLTIGPNILDLSGHAMDQNHNLINGEVPGDEYTASFTLQGLRVVGAAPNSTTAGQVTSIRITFNEPIDFARSLHGEFSLTGPDGGHRPTGVVPVSGSGNTQFDIMFDPLTAAGHYSLVLGPHVYDLAGNPMDQDGDLIPGEPTDAFTVGGNLPGPRVTGAAAGGSSLPVSSVIVTFDRPIAPASVSTGSFAVAAPDSSALTVTAASPVSGSGNTQFEVDFTSSSAGGTYTVTVHAGVTDVYGNVLAGDVTRPFSVQISYSVSTPAYQFTDIFGQAGTQTLTFTSGQVTADDDFGTINLGSNTFNFYGTAYSQLYVSSNGLITFGSGNTAYQPGDLVANPTQAAIAAYWTDLIKTGTEPMIVYRISGNQLIVEWYNVTTYPGGSSAAMTFEAVLNLNTGGQAGDIQLNYLSVTGVGAADDNSGITVGVKDASALHTVVQDGSTGGHGDPRIASGHSIRISAS